MKELTNLYSKPLPATRTGSLYNAFPYPTKISPEAIAIYIACHTKIDDIILDPFAGSGTTGLATLLCDVPTKNMLETVEELGLKPKWGKRKAILYELGTLGSFVSKVMCSPPNPEKFLRYTAKLFEAAESEISDIYKTIDDKGEVGEIRHVIWSDVLICPKCNAELTFWDVTVSHSPLSISKDFICPICSYEAKISSINRAIELRYDSILQKNVSRKKRVPVWVYGRTANRNWNRRANLNHDSPVVDIDSLIEDCKVPNYEINWGVLYRKGYHFGISHLHHIYTERNFYVFTKMWNMIDRFPVDYQDALRLLLLSYNASHSTLMSRVVVKNNNSDFVITGAQSGVLYISSLPVEKNIIVGIKRKAKTLYKAFSIVEHSRSNVDVFNLSSTNHMDLNDKVSYVFTDPPFGDYIPYSEINQINEAWLDKLTNKSQEAIIDKSQNKLLKDYGDLMGSVFENVYRALKKDGLMSLVFHSAESEVWRTLINNISSTGFRIELSSILDKVQASFKQVNSKIKVQGDPLLLFSKNQRKRNNGTKIMSDSELITSLIDYAYMESSNPKEREPERLYSRYINACIENGMLVKKDARHFYSLVELMKNEK